MYELKHILKALLIRCGQLPKVFTNNKPNRKAY